MHMYTQGDISNQSEMRSVVGHISSPPSRVQKTSTCNLVKFNKQAAIFASPDFSIKLFATRNRHVIFHDSYARFCPRIELSFNRYAEDACRVRTYNFAKRLSRPLRYFFFFFFLFVNSSQHRVPLAYISYYWCNHVSYHLIYPYKSEILQIVSQNKCVIV